jgi:DNA-directed RNA polymerase specialized sigma24 family protein
MIAMPGSDSELRAVGRFLTTDWSCVLAAQHRSTDESRTALASLCGAYWYPLYAFVRRKGHGPHEAQDLTQGFFARLLERDYLKVVDRTRGRFRAFLLVSIGHFIAEEKRQNRSLKRGGGKAILSLDFADAERRYLQEPADEKTAEWLYERRWALTLLERVMHRLASEYRLAGKEQLFAQLKSCLLASGNASTYRDIGKSLEMNEGAVKVAAHRLRKRYRELLNEEISQTVATPDDVESELRDFFAILSNAR